METTAPRRRGLGPGRIEKQGGRWFAIWTDARGCRHRRVLSSDREVAERAFRKIVRDRDLELAGLGNEAGQERALAEIVALYKADLATHRRPRYVDAVSYTLDKFVAEIGDGARIKDATVSRILLYRTKRLAAGASNRTCNADTGAIRACMNWAQSSGYIGTNPIAHLRPLPQTEDTQVKWRRALTDAEIDRLLNAATAEDADRADRFAATRTIASGVLGGAYEKRHRLKPIPQAPFWKFLVVTGLRFGEAASLRWSDFDEAEGAVTIRAEVAKSRRARVVPAPRYLVDDLRELRHVQARCLCRMPGQADIVFLSPKHKPLDRHGNPARILLRRLLIRAGIAFEGESGDVNVDIHALRKTAGTRLARHGVPLATVAAIMGHSDVRLTQRFYVDLRIADTKKAIEGLPEIGRAHRTAAPAVAAER